MAIRNVFIQFDSNLGNLARQYEQAGAASEQLQAANQKLIASQDAEAASLGRLDALWNSTSVNMAAVFAESQRLAVAQAEVAEASNLQAAALGKSNAATSTFASTVTRVAAFGTAALGFGLYEVAKAAAQFDAAMRQAAAVSDFTREHFDAMSKAVLDISTTTPQSADALAKALVPINQAGINGAAALQTLRLASQGATLGMGDVSTVAKSLVTVLQSYGQSTADIVGIQQTLFAGFRVGQTSLDGLAKGLQATASTTAALHVPVTEATAAIAAMTRTGVNAEQAGQMLQRTLFYLINPTKALAKEVVDLGVAHGMAKDATAAEVIAHLGLGEVILGLNSRIGDHIDKWEQLVPTIRTARSLFGLTADEGRNYQTVLDTLNDKQKVAKDSAIAFAQAEGSFSNQLKTTENTVKATAITYGQIVLPAVRNLAFALSGMAETARDLPGPVKNAATGVLGLALGFGAATVAAGAAVRGLSSLVTIFPRLGAAIGETSALMGPLTLAFLAIGVAVGVFASVRAETAKNEAAIKSYTDAILAEKDGVAGATQELLLQNLARDKFLGSINDERGNIDQLATLITKTGDVAGARAKAFGEWSEAIGLNDEALKKNLKTQGQYETAQSLLRGSIAGSRNDFERLRSILEDSGTSYGKQTDQLGKLTKEISNYRDAHKAAIELEKTNNSLISGQTSLLYEAGFAITDEKGQLVQLNAEQKAFQSTLTKFADADTIYSAALSTVKHSTEQFTTATEIANKAIRDLQATQKAGVKDDKSDMQDQLDKQLQAEQDQNTAVQRSDQDKTDALRATQEARVRAIQDEIDAAQERARKIAEDDQFTLSNLENVTQAQKQYYKDRSEKAQEDVRVLQDRQKAIQRQNEDETKVLEKQSRDAQRVSDDRVKAVQRTNADIKSSYTTTQDTISLSLDQYKTSLHKSADEARDWHKNLDTIYERAKKEIPDKADTLIKGLSSLGEQGADIVKKLAGATHENLGKIADDFGSLAGDATVSFNDFQKQVDQQIIDLGKWQTSIAILSGKGENNLVTKLIELGPKAAGLAAQAAQQPATALDKINQNLGNLISSTSDAAVQQWTQGMDLLTNASKLGGQHSVKALADALNVKPEDVSRIADNIALKLSDLHVPFTANLAVDLVPYLDPEIVKAHPELQALVNIFNKTVKDTISDRRNNEIRVSGPGGRPVAEGAIFAADGFETGIYSELEQRLASIASSTGADRNALISMRNQISKREEHVAQIAKASDWRVWAEPETGGEAYIPLSPTKRSRSTDILSTVANMFGFRLEKYADGGYTVNDMREMRYVAPDPQVSISVPAHNDQRVVNALDRLTAVVEDYAAMDRKIEANFYEKTDPSHVARELAWISRR